MASPTATKPDRVTGLPPGVFVGPLGRRFVALLVDVGAPAVVLLIALAASRASGERAGTVIAIGVVVVLAWLLALWWMLATRAATPGLRLAKLQLVGFTNGRPVGYGRVFVRALVFAVLGVTVLGLLVLLIFLLRSPRYQGWHDLAANAVVIKERALAPRTRTGARTSTASTSRREGPTEARPGEERQPVASVESPSGADRGPGETQPPGEPGAVPPPTGVPPAALPLAPSGVEVGAGPLVSAVADRNQVEAASTAGRPAAPPTSWYAVLDDGQEVPVHGLVLLGRNPQPRQGEEHADVVRIPDQSRTLSKSHLLLDLDANGCFVVDRGSTNGSVVRTPDGARIRCTPGAAVRVPEGSTVKMGDRSFTLRRR